MAALSWILKAPKLGSETQVYSIVGRTTYDASGFVTNIELFGGTYGSLYKWDAWNDASVWESVATGNCSLFLCVFNGEIYGGGRVGCPLGKWDEVDTWDSVGSHGSSNDDVTGMLEHNSELYAVTGGDHAYLLQFNGTNDWIEKAGSPAGETALNGMASHDGYIYAVSASKLYIWDNVSAWDFVADTYNSEILQCLCSHNDELYAATRDGSLCRLDVDTLTLVASVGTDIWSMMDYGDALWAVTTGATSDGGNLLRFDEVDTLEVKAGKYESESTNCITNLANKIYAGTGANGSLLEWGGEAQYNFAKIIG